MRKQLLVFVLLAITGIHSAFAHSTDIPGTPAPADCTVEPISVDKLFVLSSSDSVPADPHETSSDLPDPDVEAAVIDVMSVSVACTNANMPLAALSLFTDRYLIERFSTDSGKDELDHLIAASSRTPGAAKPEDQLAIDEIEPAIQYEDGRIGLGVQTSNSTESFQDIVILAEIDGVWLIDEVLLGDETILKATPVTSGRATDKTVG